MLVVVTDLRFCVRGFLENSFSYTAMQTYAVTVLRARKCGKFPRLLFFMGRGAFGACQKAASHSNSFKDWNIIS